MFCEDLQLCGEPAPGLPCDDTEAFLVEQLERLYTPREPERTEDWMFRKLRLSANQSADRAGEPVDIRNVPHARIIFDFLRDPYAEELNIMKSSAAALSTSCIIAAIHMLTEDPGNILYLITNREESIKLSKNVWQPFLRQVFGREVDTEEQGNLHLHLAGCEIFSGSPTGGLMRNKQVKYLFEDESDTMSDEVLGSGEDLEGSQMARTKNAGLRKIIRLSTPIYAYDKKRPGVTQPRTRIHRNFLRGDQREFRCPCPACRIPHAFHEDDFHCERAKGLDGSYDLDLVETGDGMALPVLWPRRPRRPGKAGHGQRSGGRMDCHRQRRIPPRLERQTHGLVQPHWQRHLGRDQKGAHPHRWHHQERGRAAEPPRGAGGHPLHRRGPDG